VAVEVALAAGVMMLGPGMWGRAMAIAWRRSGRHEVPAPA
jgi:glycerol-3-phosphate dehydrogenase